MVFDAYSKPAQPFFTNIKAEKDKPLLIYNDQKIVNS